MRAPRVPPTVPIRLPSWLPSRLPLLLALCALLALQALLPARAAADAPPLTLDGRSARVDLWPHLSIASDAQASWTIDDAQARRDAFAPPSGAAGSLGLRRDAVWLRAPLQVAADAEGPWVLDFNYAVLNRVDVWLFVDGRPARHWKLGNQVPRAERPMGGRSHAVTLNLAPGSRAELVARVQTAGAMILPVTLSTPGAFHAQSVDEQMLQGVLTGLGLFLVLYSLAQWISVREPMFASYALLTTGSVMFSVAQFGLGAQYLWGDSTWWESRMPGLSALFASTGTFLFVRSVLAADRPRSAFSRAMLVGAGLLLAVAAAFALGLIHVRVVTAVVGTLGLAPALLGLPGALGRLRRGDSIGGYFIVAWLGYFASTWVMVALIQGRLPATWWTLHAFQIGATLDMLLFLRVIGLRLADERVRAQAAREERLRLQQLAHSDPLTGLPNRLGLAEHLAQRLPESAPGRMLALFLLDLDGFKQVNDRLGHEAGDAVLADVARRLRETVREPDLVARLGGDEFVVVAHGLADATQVEALGAHLLRAFERPFEVAGEPCRIGLTAGYALAPQHGGDTRTLLKAADAAMYAGKLAGKQQVRRAAVPA